MALINGALDGSVLLVPAAGNSGARLRLGTASRWKRIRDEVYRLYGWYPEITSAGDGYRTLPRQETLFRSNYSSIPLAGRPTKVWNEQTWWQRPGKPQAAVPGTSNHGWGKTMDVVNLGGIGQFNSTRYKQFKGVAESMGFSNAEGHSIGEPWHWSDTLNPDVTDSISQEDDDQGEIGVKLDQDDYNKIYELIRDLSLQQARVAVGEGLASGTHLTQAGQEELDRIIVGRLGQALAGGVTLTQGAKEELDRLIIDRLSQALSGLNVGTGGLTQAQIIEAVKIALRQGTEV